MDLEKNREQAEREHYKKFERLAQALGLKTLLAFLDSAHISAELIHTCLVTDNYLNNIPLKSWKRMHPSVQALASAIDSGQPWPRSLSIADSVCLMKHVARYHTIPEEGMVAHAFYLDRQQEQSK
jgi:hypothetical protein